MALKVCAVEGCPRIQRESRCKAHRGAREKARGTRVQRGYDAGYDRIRRDYQQRMDAGQRFTCWRCRTGHVDPAAWTLGHCDLERSVIHGPEHPACNYATSGRQGCPHASHM